MGMIEILTMILVVLKLTNNIDWGWLQVLSPMLICYPIIIGFYLIVRDV